uniref:ABC transporter permease n=1 Tax=Ndongobacter massiliensis TaxID=1871025 RepID=UPI0009307338|nr:ABC transporter permease [Ndongobacter massiliensis]
MKRKAQKQNGFRAALARALANERWTQFTVPLFCILLTLLVSSLFLLFLGKNPLQAFLSFFAGNGFAQKANYGTGAGMLSDFFDFLNLMAPMLFAALSFIFAFRCGLFNIGISGQMLLSGFIASVTVGYAGSLPAWVAKPLVLLIAVAVGGALGALVGFLKVRFNIHEVVSTIMINYIISYLTGFFINAYYVDPISRASRAITTQARLTYARVPLFGYYCNIPLGILFAILTAILVTYVLNRTVFGFELQAVGSNRACSRYSGINVGKRMVTSLAISGMLAGLAGVTYYMGYLNFIIPKSLPSMGYDAIATALLGNSSPIGAIFASALITIFQNGASYMSSVLGVAKEIASVITGILLLFAGIGAYYRYRAQRYLEHLKDAEAEAAASSETSGVAPQKATGEAENVAAPNAMSALQKKSSGKQAKEESEASQKGAPRV